MSGHVGGPPELTQVGNHLVAEFGVAVGYYRRRSGQSQDVKDTDWYQCAVWGEHQAKLVAGKLDTGDFVDVDGDLRQRKYTTQQGVRGYENELRVEFWNLLIDKSEESGSTSDDTAAADGDVGADATAEGGNLNANRGQTESASESLQPAGDEPGNAGAPAEPAPAATAESASETSANASKKPVF